jgi:hypothetical protein
MPFRALVDGQDLSSLRITAEAWSSLGRRLKAGESVVLTTCCGSPGILKISPLGRQFFAHKARPLNCDWNPESPEHLELKAATYDAVLEVGGWSATIESNGPDWRADVLAKRGKARIAFEVQLSAQGQATTLFREGRYEEAAVLPWWLVSSRKNAGPGFGSGLRSILKGSDLQELAHAVREAVRDVLRRVESQVRIAEAIALHLRERSISYRITKFCSIPVAFDLNITTATGDKNQTIIVGELGAGVLPEFQQMRKTAYQNACGTVVQFVRFAEQIKGFRSKAFFVKKEVTQEITAVLDRVIAGKLVWRGLKDTDLIEAAFVWYREICDGCARPFARAPFAVAGHLHHWANFAPHLVRLSPDDDENEAVVQKITEQFEARENLRLGERWQPSHDAKSPALQNCPECGHTHDDSLISEDDALRLWPHPDADWLIRVDASQTGWVSPAKAVKRELAPTHVWMQALELSRRKRTKAREERRRQKEEQERASAEALEESRRRRQAEAAAAEVVRLEEARRWREEQEQLRVAAQQAREDETRAKLRSLALRSFRREDLTDLWMRTRHPTLNGSPFDICVSEFERCAALLRSH